MSILYDLSSTFITSFFWYIILFTAVHLMFQPHLRLLPTVLLEALSFLLFCMISYLPLFSFIRGFAGAAIVIGAVMLLFRGRWYNKALVSVTAMAITILCDASMIMISPFMPIDASVSFGYRVALGALCLFSIAILLSFLVFAVRLIQRRSRGEVLGRLSLLFVLYPISQYIAILGWFTPLSDGVHTGRPLVFLLALGLFIIADVGLAVAFNASARSAELRLKTEMLEQQAAAQKEQYAALAEHYDEMRRLRHDIDNHLYTIRSLLDDGKLSDASQYAQALSDSFSALRPGLELCENTAAASYLLHKKKELEAKGVALSCAATLPAALGLGDPDLICILGNLLDNAEEACAGLEGAEIRLCAAFAEPYLSFQVSNPCRPAPEKKPRRISALSRGIGTEILRRYAARYDGSYSSTQEGGQFHASLVLRL